VRLGGCRRGVPGCRLIALVRWISLGVVDSLQVSSMAAVTRDNERGLDTDMVPSGPYDGMGAGADILLSGSLGHGKQ